MSSTIRYLSLYIAITATLSLVNCFVEAQPLSQDEGKAKCMERSGLTFGEITKVETRNENCAFDCFTLQGIVQTYYAKDGTKCHGDEHRCILGNCFGPDVDQALVDTTGMVETEIRIPSAYVPDFDQLPGKGHSDPFVVVRMVEGGSPTYVDGEIICYTNTVVDEGYPTWKNFVCKPLPLKKNALIAFWIYDSDKPATQMDTIGVATEQVGYLLNRGPTKLKLAAQQQKFPDNDDYHIVVDIQGEKLI